MRKIQTHCKRGHPRTPENVNKNRGCKICAEGYRAAWLKNNRFRMPSKDRCIRGHLLTKRNVIFDKRGQYVGCRQCKYAWHRRLGRGTETELRPGELDKIIKVVSTGGNLNDIEPDFKHRRRWLIYRRRNPSAAKAIRDMIAKNMAAKMRRRLPVRAEMPPPTSVPRELDVEGYRAVIEACARLPIVMREEIQQNMMVATLEGRFDPLRAREHVDYFVQNWRREHRFDVGERRGNSSLDTPTLLGGSKYDLIGEDQRLWSSGST